MIQISLPVAKCETDISAHRKIYPESGNPCLVVKVIDCAWWGHVLGFTYYVRMLQRMSMKNAVIRSLLKLMESGVKNATFRVI